MLDDELLDLVDSEDKVIGTVYRAKYGGPDEGYLRSTGVLIINRKGEFWIPKRHSNKSFAPDSLDFSADEHVISGENYIDAAIRGLSEELNIAVNKSKIKLIGITKPSAEIPYFHQLYVLKKNKTPNYNRDDYQSSEWLTKEKLISKIDNKVKCKPTLTRSRDLIVNINTEEYR